MEKLLAMRGTLLQTSGIFLTMHPRISTGFLLLFAVSLFAGSAFAGPEETKEQPASEVDIFRTDAWEFQAVTGPFFSQQPTHSARPNFDYELTALRIGFMADTPRGHGFFRGNDEFMLEAQGSAIFQGPGSAMGGASLLYRRNFVQPNAWILPYFTAGLGGLYSDIYHDRVQRAIGGPFQFNLEAAIGVRIPIGHPRRCAIDLEASYRHISDASITSRNDGIDSVGGAVGLSFFF